MPEEIITLPRIVVLSPNQPLPTQNLLLQALSTEDCAALLPHLTRVTLNAGDRIASSASPVVRVCFPEDFVATFGEVLKDGSRCEIGMIGREGLIGWPILLGAAHSQYSGVVTLAGGTGLVMPAATLVELCLEHPSLRTGLLRFVQTFTIQMSRAIIANLRAPVERRLARWLLMLHDRVDGDALAVTHFDLAAALSVRRPSVTDRLHIMEGERVVRCARGRIEIRDRAALEALAQETYGASEESYRTLIGPFGKVPVTA